MITLNWNGVNYTTTENSSVCASDSLCSITFNISVSSSEISGDLTVYLQAINNIGRSNITTVSVGKQKQCIKMYFIIKVLSQYFHCYSYQFSAVFLSLQLTEVLMVGHLSMLVQRSPIAVMMDYFPLV